MKYNETYLREHFDEIDWTDPILHRDCNISRNFLRQFKNQLDLKKIIDTYCYALLTKSTPNKVWDIIDKIMYSRQQMEMFEEDIYFNIKRDTNFEV